MQDHEEIQALKDKFIILCETIDITCRHYQKDDTVPECSRYVPSEHPQLLSDPYHYANCRGNIPQCDLTHDEILARE